MIYKLTVVFQNNLLQSYFFDEAEAQRIAQFALDVSKALLRSEETTITVTPCHVVGAPPKEGTSNGS